MTRAAALLARQMPALAETRADGALLAAFLAARDEPAFAELVRRHGPIVWAACRRLLPDPADAEDAFQAAFLVLVRRARRLTGTAALGPWLYRVAAWTARNVRRRNARAFARRAPLPPTAADPSPGPDAAGVRADLDGALLALPEKYRTPLILCHLQGWSRRDAAARLGCPEGTLSSLLSRGLGRLREKLRGYDPAAALAVGAAVPAALAGSTVRAAAASHLAVGGAVSASVSQLVEGVIHMFWVKKATAATFVLVAVFGLGLGVGVTVREVPTASAGDGPQVPAAAAAPAAGETPRDRLTWAKRMLDESNAAIPPLAASVKASRERAAVSEKEFKAGLTTEDDHRRDMMILHRFEEQLAQALAVRATALADIAALEAKLKLAKPAAAKPKPPAPAKADQTPAALALEAELAMNAQNLARIDRQARELQDQQAKLQAEAQRLAVLQDEIKRKMAVLERQRPVADLLAAPGAGKGYLELTIGTKDAAWPFLVREVGPGEKVVGTVACENAAVLGRFLARAAKDSTGPKEVRITVRADVQQDTLAAALDACKTAGLPPALAAKPGDPDSKKSVADFIWDAQRRITEREQRYNDALEKGRADVEQLVEKYKQQNEEFKRESERLNDLFRKNPKFYEELLHPKPAPEKKPEPPPARP